MLTYYDDKASFIRGDKAINDVPFNLRHFVTQFDLSRAKSSKHHPISIAPKNWQGGEKEVSAPPPFPTRLP